MPWLFPYINRQARENHPRYLAGLLAMVERWIAKGKPKPAGHIPIIGGFEEWRDVIGGIMEANGLTELMANAEEFASTADYASQENQELVMRWWDDRESEPIKPAALVAISGYDKDNPESECCISFPNNKPPTPNLMGGWLKNQRGKQFALEGIGVVTVKRIVDRVTKDREFYKWKLEMASPVNGWTPAKPTQTAMETGTEPTGGDTDAGKINASLPDSWANSKWTCHGPMCGEKGTEFQGLQPDDGLCRRCRNA